MKCPFCSCKHIIKKYTLDHNAKVESLFLCTDCNRYFLAPEDEKRILEEKKLSNEDIIGMGGAVDDDGDIAP